MALDVLQTELAKALAQEDWEAVRGLRARLLEEHPDSDEAAEAAYRLGLDALFRGRNFEAALGHFEDAAKRRHPYWSAAARTSMALCYAQQKRPQKAMFELRKVALVKEPSAHSVAALTWMETLLLGEDKAEEAGKVRQQRIAQLKQILTQAGLPPSERGEYLYQLGCALLDQQERAEGRRVLEQARGMGPQVLGHDVLRGVNDALKQ